MLPEHARQFAAELRLAATMIEQHPELAPEHETIGPFFSGYHPGTIDQDVQHFIAYAETAARIAATRDWIVARREYGSDLEIRIPIGEHVVLRAHASGRMFRTVPEPSIWPEEINAVLPETEFGLRR